MQIKAKIPTPLRNKTLIRDKFTCKKCELVDKTSKKLEIHHVKPVHLGGTNKQDNLITLCAICHYYSPNDQNKFEEYISFKMNGFSDLLIKAYKSFLNKHKEIKLNL